MRSINESIKMLQFRMLDPQALHELVPSQETFISYLQYTHRGGDNSGSLVENEHDEASNEGENKKEAEEESE